MRFARTGLLFLLIASASSAQQPRTSEKIEVTATRIAEDVSLVPASITIIDGEELRARNARDLPSALAFVAGVSATQGSDAGPASSTPALWGLREVDAFLLVVDGVPWGGAFNPDTATVDLNDVDRIEIVRGAAPVMFGATSFVGVVHVIHRAAGASVASGRLSAGTFGSYGAAATLPLTSGAFRQSVSTSFDKRGFRDDRTGFDRSHVLYRAGTDALGGSWRLDLDATRLRQDPASPHLRTGKVLTPLVPLDANANPRNARLNEDRLQGVLGYERKDWVTTLSWTRANFKILRGFLLDPEATGTNADGFFQKRGLTDLYFDSHVVRQVSPQIRIVAGIDSLYGNAHVASDVFPYFTPVDGSYAAAAGEPDDHPRFNDRRNFSGLYGNAEWTALPQLRITAGLRLNYTVERRATDEESRRRTTSRPSGTVGANWLIWKGGLRSLALFADYRNTFKPAALDFGPDSQATILSPESAQSWEVGAKGSSGPRLRWQTSAFLMNFSNLVVPSSTNGLPILINAGSERFSGVELESDYAFSTDWSAQAGYSYHDARFRDFAQDFGGTLTQLAGKRLEMSPFQLFNSNLVYHPSTGLHANAGLQYTGPRYLNKRNTAPTGGYVEWSAGAGYRTGRGDFRIDGRNLTNRRPPVSESELGDAQYYRLPARSLEVSYLLAW